MKKYVTKGYSHPDGILIEIDPGQNGDSIIIDGKLEVTQEHFDWMIENGFAEMLPYQITFTKEQVDLLRNALLKSMRKYYNNLDLRLYDYITGVLDSLRIEEK